MGNIRDIKIPVKPRIRQQMQDCIKIHKQSRHMPKTRQVNGSPTTLRKGVISNTRQSARKVQSPVERIKASAGLAPKRSAKAAKTSQLAGTNDNKNQIGFAACRASI